MKIKIQTDGFGSKEIEAEPTVIPELFVTKAFYGEDGFSDADFVVTHAPTGFKCSEVMHSVEECQRFTKYLSEQKIPWAEIKCLDDAKPYGSEYRAARDRFRAGI